MGREKHDENRRDHYTVMSRTMMETPAWGALPPVSQALYVWLRLEWHGKRKNNNGEIFLSVKQAAECLGVHVNTAAKAFHELQRKGFAVVTQAANLGLVGEAKATSYELTEIPMPGEAAGRHLYRQWRSIRQFRVEKARANNPTGRNRKNRIPSAKLGRTVLKNEDESGRCRPETRRRHLKNEDDSGGFGHSNIIEIEKPLIASGGGQTAKAETRRGES